MTRRPPPGGARREWQTATVLEIRRETARMITLRLGLPAGSPPHVPGQHVTVRLTAPDGYTASRSYSIASAPTDGRELELMVERLEGGEVSGYLHDAVEVGDPLEVRGPFGGWFVWNGSAPALLVGGGSGVVPLMSMLRHHRRAGLSVPLRLVVSVRSPEDLPFAGEYGGGDHARLHPPHAAGLATAAGPPRRRGPAAAALPDATAYVCGSAAFAEHASQLLVDLGVPAPSVRVERYGPTA